MGVSAKAVPAVVPTMAKNAKTAVIRAAKAAGLDSYPGVFTATEALAAIAAGADALKFFPADKLGPDRIKAIGPVAFGEGNSLNRLDALEEIIVRAATLTYGLRPAAAQATTESN